MDKEGRKRVQPGNGDCCRDHSRARFPENLQLFTLANLKMRPFVPTFTESTQHSVYDSVLFEGWPWGL